jgi:methionine sulfoxide reductase catalytic subunit
LTAQKFPNLVKSPFDTDEKLNSYNDVTTYNNFYEFGLDKGDPARYAHTLQAAPVVGRGRGQCNKPGSYDIEDFLKWFPLEERIYRMRCVEAWSMVIPWVGFPLSRLRQAFEPTSKAKYVEFKTLVDCGRCPASPSRRCSGRTSKACAWTKRCTR